MVGAFRRHNSTIGMTSYEISYSPMMRYAAREGLCAIIGLLYVYINVVGYAHYQGDCMHREPQQNLLCDS